MSSTSIAFDSRPRYTTAYDHITRFQYQCMLPEYYSPASAYDIEFGTTPPHEWTTISRGMTQGVATISHMIEMHTNRYKFVLLNDNDVVDIIQILDKYLGELDTSITKDRDVLVFKELARSLRFSMYDEYRRSCKRKGLPDPEQGSLKSLLARLRF